MTDLALDDRSIPMTTHPLPTVPQLRAWFRQLDAINLTELEHRFVRALERNTIGGSAARDGFPSGRPGSGGIDAGTSVESSVLAGYRLDDPRDVDVSTGHWLDGADDPVEENLLAGCDHIFNAVAALAGAARRMDRDDDLATHKPAYDPSGYCHACDRWVEGTANDRLRSGYCDACRQAWKRWSDAELAEGREPDRAAFERQRTKSTITRPRRSA